MLRLEDVFEDDVSLRDDDEVDDGELTLEKLELEVLLLFELIEDADK